MKFVHRFVALMHSRAGAVCSFDAAGHGCIIEGRIFVAGGRSCGAAELGFVAAVHKRDAGRPSFVAGGRRRGDGVVWKT
ncbi:MAG: hypothetical protein ABMA13_10630 [Chthoniobacteraceae bacterium]